MVDALRSVFMIYFLKLAVGANLFAFFSFCCAIKFAPTAFNCNYFNGSGVGMSRLFGQIGGISTIFSIKTKNQLVAYI